ncbi:MAG: deoxyguanosinetriphosphate triphosphohydrolase family protein, partial [Planctomycetota bacterium]
FRRLQHKTQVLPSAEGDHFRTRLTHTLEVSQLARATCLSLGLNPDLGETVALAHDLGHPPFGHAGERALDRLLERHGGFRHNAQGLRIVDTLEERYPQEIGLNLCFETRVSLMKSKAPAGFPIAGDLPEEGMPFLEGQIVDLCDRAAYVSHDLEDAIRSKLAVLEDYSRLDLVAEARSQADRELSEIDAGEANPKVKLSRTISCLLSILVHDLTRATDAEMDRQRRLAGAEEVRSLDRYVATHSAPRTKELDELLDMLGQTYYRHPKLIDSITRATERMTMLFEKLLADPAVLPARFRRRIPRDGPQRTTCDYVAGMTDRYVERNLAQMSRE